MKNYLVLVVALLFFSCNQKNPKHVPIATSDTLVSKKFEEENQQVDDTIEMQYLDEKGFFVAEGKIASINSKVYVKFENKEMSKLKATIVPTTGKGNLRFNQILFPDGSSDGPYGMELETDLKQTGTYVLVIGHSQMADSPFVGNFKVQLEIRKE